MRMRSIVSTCKWLYPGMHVKRWLTLIPVGIALVVAGVMLLVNWRIEPLLTRTAEFAFVKFGIHLSDPVILAPISALLILLGLTTVLTGLKQTIASITSIVSPEAEGKLADVIYQRRYLAQGQQIVVIGGGTGLSTMLRGLKEYSSNIVAVVTVTDDGGSSGRLQREMGMLPPGDIRNCLVALADAEYSMTELFQYRFTDSDNWLEGHSFGNLLIAAMMRITGDFELAIREISRILAIRGIVLPSTLDAVRLQAEMEDGTFMDGETNIVKSPASIKHVMLCPSTVKPLEETLRAIEVADCIVMGPGSVFTSVVPNLLVEGIPDAIEKTRAVKVYVCNVMTQPGETDGYLASDHIRAITRHTSRRVFDYVLINSVRPSQDLLDKYAVVGQCYVQPDPVKVRSMGFRPILGDYISETDVVRHDPQKLAQAILRLVH